MNFVKDTILDEENEENMVSLSMFDLVMPNTFCTFYFVHDSEFAIRQEFPSQGHLQVNGTSFVYSIKPCSSCLRHATVK